MTAAPDDEWLFKALRGEPFQVPAGFARMPNGDWYGVIHKNWTTGEVHTTTLRRPNEK